MNKKKDGTLIDSTKIDSQFFCLMFGLYIFLDNLILSL